MCIKILIVVGVVLFITGVIVYRKEMKDLKDWYDTFDHYGD